MIRKWHANFHIFSQLVYYKVGQEWQYAEAF